MIHVIAFITAEPGQRAALLQDFHGIVPMRAAGRLTRRGCRQGRGWW
ncbi:MAG TPA: hypothetical protein VKI44_22900 [Acetobacteraceae bacterium]|nr:hypothetical protein [Acetobacteraceae bacterium]